MTFDKQRPLPPGTTIEYADITAIVVQDHGCTLDVICEGKGMMWYWTLNGETCQVLELASVTVH